MSATPDSTLANPEQLIADLQRQLAEREAELAECKAQRDEALQRETATAEVLGVINSSPGDPTPVFEAIIKKAMRLCEATHGGLFTYDGDLFHLAAAHSDPRLVGWHQQLGPFRPPADTGAGRISRGERLVHTADVRELDAFRTSPEFRQAAETGGFRSVLNVALRRDEALLGVLTVYRREVRPFTDKQITLLQNFAAQAVIAMENARLLTETREALEQQTATAEVLQTINSSPGDLTPVFDAMLERALALCGASFGMMNTYDGERFHAAAVRGVPEPLAEFRRRNPLVFVPGTPPALIEAGENVVHRADVMEEPSYKDGDPMTRNLVELGRARTLLVVALRKDQTLLGTLSVYRQEVRPFTDKQIALLQNFAAQAVIAMENARLITETREALEQQTATAEVLRVINSSPGDLAPVFNAMLDKAHSLCGAEHGSLLTYDGERFWRVASHRPPPVQFTELVRGGFRPGPGNPLVGVLEGERLVHIADIRQGAAERPDDPGLRILLELGLRTFLIVPLRKDGVLLGVITALRREVRPFSDKQIALLENFAAQAVIAMENARLLGELRQRTDEVAELNRGLEARVAEQVDELGRVGRLKRFLAPQLAELIVSQGDEKILESHRREIVVVFCDLRGYTAFTETAEPEEVLDFLREYHGALGPLVSQFEGTLDQFSGDGIMVFFNDPVPCPDPAERAVKMAVAMREEAGKLIAAWRRHGCELGFGAGIAQGYATLGQIGFSERSGYTAIGTVCNLAARLCAEAKDGQILVSSHIAEAVEAVARLEDLGNLELKGLRRPVAAFNVVQSTSAADARPNLTVVARGPEA